MILNTILLNLCQGHLKLSFAVNGKIYDIFFFDLLHLINEIYKLFYVFETIKS